MTPSDVSERPRTETIAVLTSLRFFAAVAIVLVHLEPTDLAAPTWVYRNFALHHAVSFFFVLSGFVQSYVYPQLEDGRAIRRFWLARVARLWPMHLFASLVWITLIPGALEPWSRPAGLPVTVAYVLLMQSWIPCLSFFGAYNAVSWTIATEMACYLVYPRLLTPLDRAFWPKWMLTAGVAVAAFACATWYGLPAFSSSTVGGGTVSGLLYIHPFGRLVEFATGMAVARFWSRRRRRLEGRPALATVLEAASVGTFLLGSHLGLRILPPMLADHYGALGNARVWFGLNGSLPFSALLVAVFACQAGQLSRALSWKPLVRLGEMTISLYLLHVALAGYYRVQLPRLAGLPLGVRQAGFWLVLLFVSNVSWRYVELPLRRTLVDRFVKNRRSGEWRSTEPGVEARFVLLRWSTVSVLLGGVAWAAAHPITELKVISSQDLSSCAVSPSGEGPVTFGGRMELVGLHFGEREGTGMRVLTTCWRSLSEQVLDRHLALHVIDANGDILRSQDVPLDRSGARIDRDTLWRTDVEFPAYWLSEGTRMALAVYRDQQLWPVDRGPSDWDGRRLIVAPEPLLAGGAPFQSPVTRLRAIAPRDLDRCPIPPSGTGAVRFGDRMELIGLSSASRKDGTRVLATCWRSLAEQVVDWHLALHVIDRSGAILRNQDTTFDPSGARIERGAMWETVVEFPADWLADGTRVALAVYRGRELLAADRGPTDWESRRLLVSLMGGREVD